MSESPITEATPEEFANFRAAINGKHGRDMQLRASHECYKAFCEAFELPSDAETILMAMVGLAYTSSAEFAARHCTENWTHKIDRPVHHELMCLGAIRYICLVGRFN